MTFTKRLIALLAANVVVLFALIACQTSAPVEAVETVEPFEATPAEAEDEGQQDAEEDLEEESPPEEEDVAFGVEEKPIRLGFVPSEESERNLIAAEDISAFIEDEFGLVVVLEVISSYDDLIDSMCNEEVEAGALPTLFYMMAAERGCADVALVSEEEGATYYQSQFIARTDSDITTYEDLIDKTICRPTPVSMFDWVTPSIALKAASVDPESDLGEVLDRDGHSDVVSGVYDRDCDAGVTYVDARVTVVDEFPDVMDQVVVIAETAEIPNDTLAYAPHLPDELREQLTQAMLNVSRDDDQQELLNLLFGWDTLTGTSDASFNAFRRQLSAAGVDVEDLVTG